MGRRKKQMNKSVKLAIIICGCLLSAAIMGLAVYLITVDHPWWAFWLTSLSYNLAAKSLSEKLLNTDEYI